MAARRPAHILVRDLEFGYDSRPVLQQIGLEVDHGDMVAVIGPNGAGKSTLLRCLTRALRPRGGVVLLEGHDTSRLPTRLMARRLGTVPQTHGADFDFTVEELVTMGRHPHLPLFAGPGPRDLAVVKEAMRLTALEPLAGRSASALSGGELQRVAIARALAQEPEILLLDEPTSHLDIAFQVEILEILRRLNRERRATVLAAIHDLNLAAQYFPRFILLARGRILATGSAEEVLQPALLREAYGVEVVLTTHPTAGCPVVLPAQGPDRRIILVTGGVRSGKSTFAEHLASRSGRQVVYVATCLPGDEEMRARVAAHRRGRPPSWITREEPFVARAYYEEVTGLGSVLQGLQGRCILVTNEVGMGLVPEWPLGRAFRDVAGRVNQFFASLADGVYLMVSGIPVKIK